MLQIILDIVSFWKNTHFHKNGVLFTQKPYAASLKRREQDIGLVIPQKNYIDTNWYWLLYPICIK